jgi:hypothetical protein
MVPNRAPMAEGFAKKLRFFGRVRFWSQFLIAFVSAPLLAIGALGRTISPHGTGFGEIYWGTAGLMFLVVATFFAFYFKRAAKKSFQDQTIISAKRPNQHFGFLARGRGYRDFRDVGLPRRCRSQHIAFDRENSVATSRNSNYGSE